MPMEVLRAPSPRDHHAMHDAPYPHPPGSAGPSHDGYEYGAQHYDEQHPHPHPGMAYEPGPVVPAASYRFGGPSQGSNAPLPPPPPPNGAAYHDYPMSRPPLSHRGSGNSSPGRPSLPHPPPPQPPRPLDQLARHSPTPSLKRKTSDESAAHEEGYGSYPANSPYLRGPPSAGAPPHPKRRTSTLTYEKLNGLSLAEQQRRDSSFGPISPWEEDRRGSDESYGSHSSHGYPVPAYQHVHPSVQGYELRAPPPSSAPPPPHHGMQHGPAWDAQQVGPRGSIARGMYGDEPSSFARRPSIPSVSQMMQGQQPFYPVGGAPPAPRTPARRRRGLPLLHTLALRLILPSPSRPSLQPPSTSSTTLTRARTPRRRTLRRCSSRTSRTRRALLLGLPHLGREAVRRYRLPGSTSRGTTRRARSTSTRRRRTRPARARRPRRRRTRAAPSCASATSSPSASGARRWRSSSTTCASSCRSTEGSRRASGRS